MSLAVITGGTKGIGKAVSLALANRGYDLAICSRSEKDLAAWKIEMQSSFPDINLLTLKADVGIKSEVNAFGNLVKEKLGIPDVLINNAGIFTPGGIEDEDDGALEVSMAVNTYSAYYLTRCFITEMKTRRSGHIFNICSIASIKAYTSGASYGISKFAMLGFSKILRQELMEFGVKVTSVLPGATWSDSWKGVDFERSRLMEAEDIALAVTGALDMSNSAVVEEIVLRPQLGDL